MDTFSDRHKNFARGLRKEPTKAEAILWDRLRSRKLNNLKFRRQHIVENYVVDFYCHEYRLIVEVDGVIHNREDQEKYDRNRQLILENSEYILIRFSNTDIVNDIEFVLQKITGVINSSTT